jgi:hypothetical protein
MMRPSAYGRSDRESCPVGYHGERGPVQPLYGWETCTLKPTPRAHERGTEMKPTEYGGSDTKDTLGIQPAPHYLRPEEKLRVLYHGDPMDVAETPIPGLSTEE